MRQACRFFLVFCFDLLGASGEKSGMETGEFTPDCASCVALCCLALAFDKGAQFGHDKPAGMPCEKLEHHACGIHAQLTDAGYGGCVAYDCLGAGQRVSALYGQSWREVPKLAGPMMRDFALMREVQDLRQMLVACGALDLPDAQARARATWVDALDGPWDQARLADFAEQGTAAQLRVWLRGLSDVVSR